MKCVKLFVILAIMCIPPWGFILKPLGNTVQFIGVVVQLMGLVTMILKRKSIWNLPQ